MQCVRFDLSKVKGAVAIITAAGIGSRFGEGLAKQYHLINGKKILDITLERFIKSDKVEKILLMISAEDTEFEKLTHITNEKIIVIDGGEERQQTVNNGLSYLYDNGLADSIAVLIHDAVRPCLTEHDLECLFSYFSKEHQACFLAKPVTDSLKKVSNDNMVKEDVNRTEMVRALTPQMANFIELKNASTAAINSAKVFTDDVGTLTANNVSVAAVFGEDLNPKITHKKDIKLAEAILLSRE